MTRLASQIILVSQKPPTPFHQRNCDRNCMRIILITLIVSLLLSVTGTSFVSAQIGDRLDKPGVVQKSLVPKDQIPPSPVLSPDEALSHFTVAPGYHLELAAHEPQVQEPVAAVFDPDGKLWVAEMRGYMPDVEGTGEDQPNGRIVCLEDRDGDGFYESSHVFIDELVLPRALLRVADGLLVGAPPELAFYRDTDGDGKADTKEVLAIDYGVKVDPARPHLANPERAPNNLMWAFDNWIYSTAYTRRFRYRDGKWEVGTTSFRGQWGLTQDDYGRIYYCSNSDHIRVDVIDNVYLARQPNFTTLGGTNVNAATDQLVWPARVTPGINRGYQPAMLREGRLKEFTAAGGITIYGGARLKDLKGSYFIGEPAGNLVRRSILNIEGGTVTSANAYDSAEFIASTDERFRPVSVLTGPDDSLYIVDFYRGILQHRISLTTYLRQQILDRALDKGLHYGRIYRVVADENAESPAIQAPKTLADWVTQLENPSEWWRRQAQRILVESADTSTVDAIREEARSGRLPMGRVHALWTLEGIGEGALDAETVLTALDTADAVVQAHAIRVAEAWLQGDQKENFRTKILTLAEDSTPEVRLQAILSLGESGDSAVEDRLSALVLKHRDQPFLLDAFLSGLKGRERAVLKRLEKRAEATPNDATSNLLLRSLVRGIQSSRDLDAIAEVITLAKEALDRGQGKRAAALLEGLIHSSGSRRPFIFDSAPKGWAELENDAITRPITRKLLNVILWEGKPGATVAVTPPPLTSEEQDLFDTGATLYAAVCASCHQSDGRGLEGLAPPLLDSEWVLGPSSRTVRIVLHGVRGPIRVLGKTHTGDMPPQGVLSDDQIAGILTYVRRAWGHTASPVSVTEVANIRKETADHLDAWSPEELNQIQP